MSRSPDAVRDEWRRYARRVIVRSPLEAVRVPQRAWRARQARRGAPADFRASDSRPVSISPHSLPLQLPGAAVPIETIALASMPWPLRRGAPWSHHFEDPEDRFAAQRFSWVIPALAAHGHAALPVLSDLLEQWLQQNGARTDGDGWDSYSVAERLAAAVYLLSASRGTAAATPTDAVRAHAEWLSRNLEWRGASTNNHLLNDARALYLAGFALGEERFAHQARELFDFAVPRMFIEGFLREGSTHYHLLLLRTLVEVALAARVAADLAFAERMHVRAGEVIAAARFFARGPMETPLVGDLSPDFTPDFLMDLAAGPATGWGALLGTPAAGVPEFGDGIDARAAAGYYRAASGGFRIWSWVNPDGYVPAWSHAHGDLGSFVASWQGQALLIDAGRATYAAGPMSDFGRGVRSHNAISIDGAEPCVVHGLNGYPELFRSDYRDARPRAEIARDGGIARLRVAHDGFARFGSGMTAARTISLGDGELRIEDDIRGSGQHTIETFFHFAPEATVERIAPARWRVTVPEAPPLLFRADIDAEAVRGREGDAPMGWTSRRYGHAVPTTSLIFTQRAALPLASTYLFSRA